MESDQNRPQADDAERPPAAQDPGHDQDPGPGHSGETEFSGFKADAPQAGHSAHSTAEPERGFTGEPDFSGFTPGGGELVLPRWLHVSLLWVLGLGAVAAMVMAAMFVSQERKTDKTLELLAFSSRSGMDVAAVPVAAPVAEKKPTDMVFLKNPGQDEPARAERPEAATARAVRPAERAMPPAARAVPSAGSAARPATPVAAKQRAAKANTGPAVARGAKAAPAKAKPTIKKKKPNRKKATVLARRTDTQTWPRPRGDSITERLNAAVRACRSRPHAPGECNLRACDILGSSDPACR